MDGGARLPDRQREILRLAALLHDVGRSKSEKGRQKATHGLIRRLHPPLGVSSADLQLAGVVARYHRGALPRAGQKALRSVARGEREMLLRLAAILRLADAFDAERNGAVGRLDVCLRKDFVVVQAQGYSPLDADRGAGCRRPPFARDRLSPAGHGEATAARADPSAQSETHKSLKAGSYSITSAGLRPGVASYP